MTAHGLPDEFILGLFAAGIAVMFCGVIATSIWRRADVTSDQLFWAGTNAAAHPERYVRPDRVMAVRVLNTTGVSLFLGAVLLLLAQAVRRLL